MSRDKLRKFLTVLIILLVVVSPLVFLVRIQPVEAVSNNYLVYQTTTRAISYPFQRNSFYSAGRYWWFFRSGNTYVFSSSPNRVDWESATVLGASATESACFYNGSHVAATWKNAGEDTIYFRQGEPQSDGTIVWDAVAQIVRSSDPNFLPSISIDANGYAWITWNDWSVSGSYGHQFVSKNANTDGTWTDDSGFPYQASTTNTEWAGFSTPLDNGEILLVYCDSDGRFKSRNWNLTGWESEVTITATAPYQKGFSAVNVGNDVWMTYYDWDDPDNEIAVQMWNYTSHTWGSASTLLSTTSGLDLPSMTYVESSGNLEVFFRYSYWGGGGTNRLPIWKVEYNNISKTWGSPAQWITPSEYNYQYSIVSAYYYSAVDGDGAEHYACFFASDGFAGGGSVYDYFMGLEYEPMPKVGNGTITDMDYGNWVLTNTKYYEFWANYTHGGGYGSLTTMSIAFTDGNTWINVTYSATDTSWTLDSGTGYVYIADGTTSGSGTLINVTFPIFLTNSMIDALDVDIYLYCADDEAQTDGWTLTDADHFNIYNTGEGGGGIIDDTTTGDGYRVIGGCPFDLAVQNGTAGSTARVNMYVANFQHLNTFVHLWQDASWDATSEYWDCITEHNQTGYLEYGVDYYLDDAWVEGWKVQLEVLNASAGTFGVGSDESYVVMNVSWYNRGSLIKSDTLVVMYEAYQANDLTTHLTLWVDLWISNLAGSSMVAGHVSAQYYGMSETGWWLWADWGPVYGTLTTSTFHDNLQDANNNVTTASSLYMFRVWTKLAKTGEGGGPTDCDEHWWTSNHEICANIRTLPSTENLTGIMTPTLQPTTTPDMPIGYFPSLANSLIEVLLRIETTLTSTGTYIYSMATETIDSLFEAGLGVPDFTATISGLASAFGAYVADSVTYVTSLLTMIFGLFAGIALFIIDWLGRIVTLVLQIAGIVQSILDGTSSFTTGVGNIWEFIEIENWIDAVPLFMLLGWFVSIDSRARRSGSWMGIFWGDISMIMSVFSFMFDMSMRVISLIIDWAARFATFLLPL